MGSAINVQGLNFSYKVGFRARRAILKELSFSVSEGDTVGFLGPNGAGKTTTIKVLLGLLSPDSGAVSILGYPAGSLEVRRRIGYLPELAYYYWYLTSEELLRMYAGLFGLDRTVTDNRIENLLKTVELDKYRKTQLRYYSKGMLHRAGLAQALINDPQVLILDEPTSGLDPVGRMKVRKIIKDLKAQGKTIFFSSHELSEAELICDKIAIIKDGHLLCYNELKVIVDSIVNEYHEDIPNKLERYFLEIISGGR